MPFSRYPIRVVGVFSVLALCGSGIAMSDCDTNDPTCTNNGPISVVEQGNNLENDSPFCNPYNSCGPPIERSTSYSKTDSSCSPDTNSSGCEMTVDVLVEFPGNRQNACDKNSVLAGAIYRVDGNLQGQCGRSSSWTINEDLALFTVTVSNITCDDQRNHRLDAIMCEPSVCPGNTTKIPLDFAGSAAAGCPGPPQEVNCNQPGSCEECIEEDVHVASGAPGYDVDVAARFYYSAGGVGAPGTPGVVEWVEELGRYWSHDYAERIVIDPVTGTTDHVWLLTRWGTFREFKTLSGDTYTEVSPTDEFRTLRWTGSEWLLEELNGDVHHFDGTTGRWAKTVLRPGVGAGSTIEAENTIQATYNASNLTVDFPDGRKEIFHYDTNGRLSSLEEVGVDGSTSRTWTFDYNGTDDLHRIIRPDSTEWKFFYDDTRFPGYITRREVHNSDGTDLRIDQAWSYNSDGRVTKVWRGSTSYANGTERRTITYDEPDQPTTVTVSDVDDADQVVDTTTYTLSWPSTSRKARLESVSGGCPLCGTTNTDYAYPDAETFLPNQVTDGNGNVTQFGYSTEGMVTSRVEAFTDTDTSLHRRMEWDYHTSYPSLVTQIRGPFLDSGTPSRITTITYDSSGNLDARQIEGDEVTYEDPPGTIVGAFNLTTNYTTRDTGEIETINPPDNSTADVVTFEYLDADWGDHKPSARIDPDPVQTSGTVTTSFGYDVYGNRTTVTDPNGTTTETTFDDLDRVTQIVAGLGSGEDLTTEYRYNKFGDLKEFILPRDNVIFYTYDSLGRLHTIERSQDETVQAEQRVRFEYDSLGNREFEYLERFDESLGAWTPLSVTKSTYTSRCKLEKVTRGFGSSQESTTEYDYDCNGNLKKVWDPNHTSATDDPVEYFYDALNRLTSIEEPWGPGGSDSITEYAYDLADNLTTVTDANDNVTTYEYSDRDLLTEEISTVSGTTTHTYNDHGQLVKTNDGRSLTIERVVDVADRLTKVDFPSDSDIVYAYGDGTNSFDIGRIASITRGSTTVAYEYDRFGRVTKDGALDYGYDANGNRNMIDYPIPGTGDTITAMYKFDFADRPNQLTVATPQNPTPAEGNIASSGAYRPSGPLASLELGNGLVESRAFTEAYFPDRILLEDGVGPVLDWAYTTDPVGNITEIKTIPCQTGGLQLTNATITTTRAYEDCDKVTAGTNYDVSTGGDLTLTAGNTVVLTDGFSVTDGTLTIGTDASLQDGQPRIFDYQPYQYFLTDADGPWGTLDWTYDRIGNREDESRDGAPVDNYKYLQNAASLNTPQLNQIDLSGGGTRTYDYTTGGHLEDVNKALANPIHFTINEKGRVTSATRTAPDPDDIATFTYDGRSYLTEANSTGSTTATITPTYGSEGLLHQRHDGSNTETIFYFGNRPIAILNVDDAGAESWTYLTTDHLSAPILASDDDENVNWEGGFEPFGKDWQQLTTSGASENGVFLRLPGQWDSQVWADATLGADLFYNVHRWYEDGTGRYSRSDPVLDDYRGVLLSPPVSSVIPKRKLATLAAEADVNHYSFADQNPILFTDPFGLRRVRLPGVEWQPPEDQNPPAQSEGCDCVNEFFENRWTLSCCECHDACYFQNNCSAGSWGGTVLRLVVPFIPDRPCDSCNKWAMSCFAAAPGPVPEFLSPKCPWPIPDNMFGQKPRGRRLIGR